MKKTYQRGFAQIILVVFVVIVGIGAISYYAYKNGQIKTPSQNQSLSSLTPTAIVSEIKKWKIYTDQTYHYQIKYPPEWIYWDYSDGLAPNFKSPEPGQGTLPKYNISIGGGNNPTNTYDKSLFNVWGSTCVGDCPEEGDEPKIEGVDYQFKEPVVETKKINNAIVYYLTSYYGQVTALIPVPDQKVYLLIKPNFWPKNESVDLFNQILSTFKFFNPNPDSEPIIFTPKRGDQVISPLTVKGTIPAGWIFEGTFPIKLVDEDKKLIVQGQAIETIPDSWRIGKPVNFTATLHFTTSALSGYIVLENNNQSGDPTKTISYEMYIEY